jgi:beta-glucosidase
MPLPSATKYSATESSETESPATESGDRSHAVTRIESVAQLSAVLQDTDPTLDPRLAALARQAAGEGTVLLRNDGVLPLSASARVAVFGRVQLDWFAVGYGSGGDVHVPYIWNLLSGLVDAGVQVDHELADLYRSWTAENRPAFDGTWGHWPHHFAEMPVTDEVVAGAAGRTDVAMVVIGRAAGEARDSVLEDGSYYLTDDERDLIDRVTTHFAKTVVVLDVGNVMDLGWLDGYGDRIAGLVCAWQGGMEGARAVAGVLSGEIPPSGRLTDTIARTYDDYPSAAHFGDPDVNVYAEDVFVGYRYFETFAPDRVLFPFGFGLSYATLVTTVIAVERDGDTVRVRAEVRNSGTEHQGAETVQVYASAPDFSGTRGTLSTPARALIAFAKSRVLAPGEVDLLDLEIDLADLASFDDGGVTGHRDAWVLLPGAYRLLVGTDVRSAHEVATVEIPDLRVVRACAEAAAPDPAHPFDRMIRRTGDDGTSVIDREPVPTATVSRAERVLRTLPEEMADPGGAPLSLDDVAAGAATIEAFVGQLSVDDLSALVRGDHTMHSRLGVAGNAGVLGGVSEALRARGVRPVTTTDGPSGIRVSAYASLLPSGTALASTWNVALVRELGALHGEEMVRKGSDVLLSPGMNIHRDPLCGRNFEYFSEDPVVTGRMAAAVVSGVQSRGVAACPKHFAANNQETNRTRNDSRVSQRALREIYLRGFEICVREARPRVIMTSYNQVNGVWAHYHHDLVTVILRDDWGYRGCVITDWWMEDAVDPDFPALNNNAYRVRAQVDVLMPGGVKTAEGPQPYGDDSIHRSLEAPDGLTRGELQRSARNVLGLVLALVPVIDARASRGAR